MVGLRCGAGLGFGLGGGAEHRGAKKLVEAEEEFEAGQLGGEGLGAVAAVDGAVEGHHPGVEAQPVHPPVRLVFKHVVAEAVRGRESGPVESPQRRSVALVERPLLRPKRLGLVN